MEQVEAGVRGLGAAHTLGREERIAHSDGLFSLGHLHLELWALLAQSWDRSTRHPSTWEVEAGTKEAGSKSYSATKQVPPWDTRGCLKKEK